MKRMIAVAVVLFSGTAAAADGFRLYPVRGVYFAPASVGDARKDLIDPDFRTAIGDSERSYFEAAFRKRFPDAAQNLDERTRRRTFAVSLQVARASRYFVKKVDGTSDVLLPVTASLYFTNVFTGEILYSATRTLITRTSIMTADAVPGAQRVVALFGDTFRGVADQLIEDAGQRFKPVEISATARGESSGRIILDAGTDRGLAAGDTLASEAGAELQVIAAAPAYSVADVVLSAASAESLKGTTFRKVTNGTLADVKKPRVLAVVEELPDGFPEDAVVQLFSDALGATAPVSLVPVNRTFAEVLKTIAATTDLSQEKLRSRELPAFFVRLHVPEPISFERSTNISYKTLRVTETLAFAELVDTTGRVLFTAIGRDKIEDEITAGMALSSDARKEVAVKNALIALAKQFAKLRFDRAELQVSASPAGPSVKDDRGLLGVGAAARVFRSIGDVGGITGEVLVPAWEVSVAGTENGTASITPTLPLVAGASPVRDGDRLVIDGVAARKATRNRFASCGEANRAGAVELPNLGALTFNLFASAYDAPTYARGLGASVGALVRAGAGFREDVKLSEPEAELCVETVYKIDPIPQECEGGACADAASVMFGYRVRAGGPAGEVRGKSGLATRVTARSLPTGTADAVRRAALTADLLNEMMKLGASTATALGQQKL